MLSIFLDEMYVFTDEVVMGTRGVNTDYEWIWKYAIADTWKVREAKMLQACEIPSIYSQLQV